MKDVARATSAAPTYFPSAEICNILNKPYSLIDGGLGCNNPSILVINDLQIEARNSMRDNDYYLLSLGTGEE